MRLFPTVFSMLQQSLLPCDLQTTATMFAVMNGFIIATILSSASSRHRYKERMDMIMVRSSSLPLILSLLLSF